jgi:hypothetical protein
MPEALTILESITVILAAGFASWQVYRWRHEMLAEKKLQVAADLYTAMLESHHIFKSIKNGKPYKEAYFRASARDRIGIDSAEIPYYQWCESYYNRKRTRAGDLRTAVYRAQPLLGANATDSAFEMLELHDEFVDLLSSMPHPNDFESAHEADERFRGALDGFEQRANKHLQAFRHNVESYLA